jgi:hypothetical protein
MSEHHTPTKTAAAVRDRIRELRRVKASELRANPRNWRTHPSAQRAALEGVLTEIGYASALLARELPDGSLELVDGHLRAETTPDQEVPVLIVDVNESEANKILATLDPLSALAETHAAKLDSLLTDIETGNEALSGLLSELAAEGARFCLEDLGDDDETEGERDFSQRQTMVNCVLSMDDVSDFEAAIQKTGEVNRAKALAMICRAYLNDE